MWCEEASLPVNATRYVLACELCPCDGSNMFLELSTCFLIGPPSFFFLPLKIGTPNTIRTYVGLFICSHGKPAWQMQHLQALDFVCLWWGSLEYVGSARGVCQAASKQAYLHSSATWSKQQIKDSSWTNEPLFFFPLNFAMYTVRAVLIALTSAHYTCVFMQ